MSADPRKPYESPEIRTEEVIETTTMACGKCEVGGPTGAATPACQSLVMVS